MIIIYSLYGLSIEISIYTVDNCLTVYLMICLNRVLRFIQSSKQIVIYINDEVSHMYNQITN